MTAVNVDSEQQVIDLVQWAAAEKHSLSIQGYNSKAGFGHPLATHSQVSTRNLTGIVSYNPEELIMTALPGTTLAEVESELARKQQCLPFEPARLDKLYGHAEASSIAGVFAGNLAGPARFKTGAARDYLLGITAVNGRGEKYQSGGKVIKNVSGYDICKLIAGSWGTLSILTELTFKVLPAPAVNQTLIIQGQASAMAQTLFQQLLRSPYAATGLAYIPQTLARHIDSDSAATFIRIQGTQISTDSRVAAIKKQLLAGQTFELCSGEAATTLWETVRDVGPLADKNTSPVIMKLSIPPASMTNISDVLEQLSGCLWFADAGGAWLWVGICSAGAADKIMRIRRAVEHAGGNGVVYRATEKIIDQLGVFALADPLLAKINTRLKHSFDPLQLFNPGRLGHFDAN